MAMNSPFAAENCKFCAQSAYYETGIEGSGREYVHTGKQYQNMLTASGVTLLNKFDDKPIKERKINYRYYIMEAYKIIRDLKPLQLSLWD